MTLFKCLCLGLINFFVQSAFSMEQMTLIRNIVIESCSEDLTECEPISTDTASKVDIPLSFAGKSGGLHGEARFQTMQANTPFKSEIFVNKLKNGFSIYAVLRSGHGTKRHGVTKTIKTDNFLKFEPIELVDKPILIDGKTYRAKMAVTSTQPGG